MASPSYPAWYGLPEQDPYGGRYTEVCAALSAINPTMTSGALWNHFTLGGQDTKAAFLLLGSDDRLCMVHRLQPLTAVLGVPSIFAGGTFATFGDVTLMGATTVMVPAQLFHSTGALPVRTAGDIDAGLLAAPEVLQLDQLAEGDAAAEEIRTRCGMFVPPAYVPSIRQEISSPGGLTPRGLWEGVISKIRGEAGQALACQSFVDWARVIVSHGSGADNLLRQPAFLPVHPDAILGAARAAILRRDLPHRFAPAADLAPVVQELGALRADAANRALALATAEATKAAASKLPSKRWHQATDRLLNLCQVDSEADLPTIWSDMVVAGAKMDRVTIQYHLRIHATPGNARAEQVPVCTQGLAKELGSLVFAPVHRDDLRSGMSIFTVCHPDQESARRANEVAGYYDSQLNGTTGITIADDISLKAAQEFNLPSKLLQVKRVCWAYHRLLAVHMGDNHCVVLQFAQFLDRMDCMEVHLDSILDGNTPKCAGFLRFVHVKMYLWFRAQEGSGGHIPAPAFEELLDKIEEDTWIPAMLPSEYLTPPRTIGPTRLPIAPSPTVLSPSAQAVGGITSGTGFFKVPPGTLDPLVKVRPNFNIRSHISAHGPPPNNDGGGLMCLSYHVRGSCRHECDRGTSSGASHDHKRHSSGETKRLIAYLDKAGPIAAPSDT